MTTKGRTTQKLVSRGVTVLPILGVLLFSAGVARAAAPAPSTTVVKAAETWTRTGITMQAGERVTITATGRAHFGASPIDAISPAGIPWGSQCARAARGQQRASSWPAPGVACWSLIARVGGSAPVAVGRSAVLTAPRAGPLELGINDNYIADNRGSWTGTITLNPIASTKPPTKSQSSSNLATIVLVVVAASALVIALVVFARRRRGPRSARPAPLRAAAASTSVLGPENEDVNIFEAEFVEGGLRVGYSYFPDGTVVRWQIIRDGGAQETGEFDAIGGADPHYVVLGLSDTAHASPVVIRFQWYIADVPFEYAITRDPTLQR